MSIVPSDPQAPLAILGLQAGPRSGEEIPVHSPVVTIGQGSQNDLVLDDDSVSTRHARLEYELGGWRLTDLGSTNGTYVEGVRLAPEVPTPLLSGSLVRFGGLGVEFREGEAADPDAARASHDAPGSPAPAGPRRFRLPVWLFVLILLLIIAVVYFLLQPGEPAVGVAAATPYLALSPPPLVAP